MFAPLSVARAIRRRFRTLAAIALVVWVAVPAGATVYSARIAPDTPASTAIATAAQLAPAARQLRWQHEELTAFIHFGPDTFTGLEIGTGTEHPDIVNPRHYDPEQWMRTLQDAGFKKVMLTTKHHDGFTLWPSRYTTYGVRSSRWKHGHGDMVREFVTAAHRHGIAVGLYLSPADLHQALPGGPYADGSRAEPTTIPTLVPGDTRHPNHFFHYVVDDYNRYYLNQLYELLTQYGPVDEIFLDGYNPLRSRHQSYAFTAWYDLIRALQPEAVMFGGLDVNWVGNEDGVARQSQWSVIPFISGPRPDQVSSLQDPVDPHAGNRASIVDPKTRLLLWYPAECDARLEATWFWHPNQPPKTLDALQTMYYTSVGRNCQLILDVPPDKSGRFDAADVARLHEFGIWRRAHFGADLALGVRATRTGKNTTVYTLPATVGFRTVGLAEDLTTGQRVENFALDVAAPGGAWTPLVAGTTIGYKRLLRLPAAYRAERLRLRILAARATPQPIALSLFR